MAYDEGLAERLRELFPEHSGIAEKKMFGGLCFLSRGYMFVGIVGIVGEALMARVGPDAYEKALRRPHARVMDFTGRPMKGCLRRSARLRGGSRSEAVGGGEFEIREDIAGQMSHPLPGPLPPAPQGYFLRGAEEGEG